MFNRVNIKSLKKKLNTFKNFLLFLILFDEIKVIFSLLKIKQERLKLYEIIECCLFLVEKDVYSYSTKEKKNLIYFFTFILLMTVSYGLSLNYLSVLIFKSTLLKKIISIIILIYCLKRILLHLQWVQYIRECYINGINGCQINDYNFQVLWNPKKRVVLQLIPYKQGRINKIFIFFYNGFKKYFNLPFNRVRAGMFRFNYVMNLVEIYIKINFTDPDKKLYRSLIRVVTWLCIICPQLLFFTIVFFELLLYQQLNQSIKFIYLLIIPGMFLLLNRITYEVIIEEKRLEWRRYKIFPFFSHLTDDSDYDTESYVLRSPEIYQLNPEIEGPQVLLANGFSKNLVKFDINRAKLDWTASASVRIRNTLFRIREMDYNIFDSQLSRVLRWSSYFFTKRKSNSYWDKGLIILYTLIAMDMLLICIRT
jgi:hypothetical protein